MEKCVLNASMGKFGISIKKNVFVKMVKNGMVSFVKRHINVQETESGIPHLIAVYAKITTTGVVMHAFQFHHAKVANFGIQF